MPEEISLEDYKRAYREMKTEEARRGFLAHLAVYVLVNTILVLINLLYSPHVMWFFYPLLGWGIGIPNKKELMRSIAVFFFALIFYVFLDSEVFASQFLHGCGTLLIVIFGYSG